MPAEGPVETEMTGRGLVVRGPELAGWAVEGSGEGSFGEDEDDGAVSGCQKSSAGLF